MKSIITAMALVLVSAGALAKLPALSDDAKAKAAEAAAKTAHGNKVADFQLCKSREKTATHYFKTAQAAGKSPKPALETAACADPGAFVYTPPGAAAPATAAVTPAAPAAAQPAVPAAAPAKKS